MARNISYDNTGTSVHVPGSILPKGTGTPVIRHGSGFTVSRVGLGHYRATFTETVQDLVSAKAVLRSATSTAGVSVRCGDWDKANKRLDFYVHGLYTGKIPIPLGDCSAIVSNDVPVEAKAGFGLGKDSEPILERVNGATDKALRIRWAASVVDEIQLPNLVKPADMDFSEALTLKMRAAISGTSGPDTVVMTLGTWDGVGDTEITDTSAAITGETIATYSVTVAGGELADNEDSLNFRLTPASHGNDAVVVYGLWWEYTRLANLVDLADDADNTIDFEAVFV